jgi:hypothetical protein
VASELRAEGNSAAMGALMTVVPDGASDAARNPALLGFQKKGRSVATALRATPYSKMTADMGGAGDFDYEEYTAGITVGYSWRSGSLVYALAYAQVPDKEQVGVKKITQSFKGMKDIPSLGNYYLESTYEERTQEYNPSFIFAWAFPLSGDGYLGMQIIAGLSYVKTDASSRYYIPAALHSGKSELSTTLMGFSLEAGFGYTQRLGNGHTGIMVRTGSLTFDHQSGEGEFYNSLSGGSSDSGDTGNIFRYSMGISIMTGFYQRPLPSFGFALEAGYRFPVSYKYHEPGEESSQIVESASQVTVRDKFEFKGGVEWIVSQSFSLTGGLVLSFNGKVETNLENEGNDGRNTETQNYTILAFLIGTTYRLNENTLLTAAMGYIRVHFEIEKMLESNLTRGDLLFGAVHNY